MAITYAKHIIPSRNILFHLYWEENLSTYQIGYKLGYSQARIVQLLHKYKIDCRSPHATREKYSFPSNEELRHLYWDENKSLADISNSIGIPAEAIRIKMVREGILRRDRNDLSSGKVKKLRLSNAKRKLKAFEQITLVDEALQKRFILSPDYIVGLTDGEGSFSVCIDWRHNPPVPYCAFSIANTYIEILDWVENYFGFGNVYRGNKNKSCPAYNAKTFPQCLNIAKFFCEHPPKIRERQFRVWLRALHLIAENNHTTEQGLREILILKEGLKNDN